MRTRDGPTYVTAAPRHCCWFPALPRRVGNHLALWRSGCLPTSPQASPCGAGAGEGDLLKPRLAPWNHAGTRLHRTAMRSHAPHCQLRGGRSMVAASLLSSPSA